MTGMANVDDPRKETAFIDGVKVILCSMVAFGHFYNYIGGRYIYGIRIIGGMGARAVDVFFFLTAFLTLISYRRRKRHAGEFFINRLKRLYPEYIPVILTAIITVGLRSYSQQETLFFLTGDNIGAWGYEYTVHPFPDLKSIILHLLFCNGIISCQEILGVTWSLPIEVWFYFIFMLVILISNGDERKDKLILLILYIISLLCGILYFLDGAVDHQQHIIRSLPIMFTGLAFADMYLCNMEKWKGWILSAAGVIYLFLLDVRQNWMSALIIVFVMILLEFENKLFFSIKGLLSTGVFKEGCRLSYSIYLIHTIVISFVFAGLLLLNKRYAVLSKGTTVAAALILSVVITVLLSMLNNKFAGYLGEKMRKRL